NLAVDAVGAVELAVEEEGAQPAVFHQFAGARVDEARIIENCFAHARQVVEIEDSRVTVNLDRPSAQESQLRPGTRRGNLHDRRSANPEAAQKIVGDANQRLVLPTVLYQEIGAPGIAAIVPVNEHRVPAAGLLHAIVPAPTRAAIPKVGGQVDRNAE